jgi:hypothetical protein
VRGWSRERNEYRAKVTITRSCLRQKLLCLCKDAKREMALFILKRFPNTMTRDATAIIVFNKELLLMPCFIKIARNDFDWQLKLFNNTILKN